MRGMGQIRELARIARPDVGVITNVGPVHLELVGTVERVAEAKAELIARAGARRGVRRAGRRGGAAAAPALATCGCSRSRHPGSEGVEAIAGAAADVRALAVEPQRRGPARRGRGRRRARARSSSTSPRPTTSRTRWPRSAPLHALGVPLERARRGRARRCGSRACGERSWSSRTASSSSTIATTPTRCRCVPPSTTSPPWPTARGARRVVAVLGDMRELGPAAPEFHREIGALAAEAGVEVLLAVGEHAADYVRGLRPPGARGAGRGAGGRAGRRPRPGGRRGAREGLARRSGSSGSRETLDRRTERPGLMGEILIAGLASLLISIFLGPKYIEYLRDARVRAAHPRGGPGRAPHEGGHADDGRARDLHRDRRPVPDPVRPRCGQHGGVRHRARVRGDRVRGRLAEDREGTLARPVRAHQAVAPGADRDRAVAGRDARRSGSATRSSSASSTARSTSAASTWC